MMVKQRPANKVLPKAGLKGFDCAFVQGSIFVPRLNFMLKNPPSAIPKPLATTLILIMNKMEIRLASKQDAQFIALLARVTFTETFGHLYRDNQDLMNYYDSTFSVEKIENSLQKADNVFWIAFVNRLPVGYAKLKLNSKSIFIDSEHVCQLQKIYVLKDFLSMKIGFELQNQLLEKAKELGFEKIWLSVLESNERAINFYRTNGFKAIGNHDFRIGKENFDFVTLGRLL